MTREEFLALVGPCEPWEFPDEYEDIIFQCNVTRENNMVEGPVFLPGQLWTWGYFLPDDEPAFREHDWAALAEAVLWAREWADFARENDLSLQTESDVEYVPFVLELPEGGGDFLTRFKIALGMDLIEQMEFVDVDDPRHHLFFGDLDLQMENLEDYFSDEEIAAYQELNARMADALGEVSRLTFDSMETNDMSWYVTSPEFFVGLTDAGYVTGLWSYITRT